MKKIKDYAFFLFLMAIAISCVEEHLEMPEKTKEKVVYLRTLDRETVATRTGASDAAIDPQSVYILVFSGQEDNSLLLDWTKAVAKSGDSYTVTLKKQSGSCYAYVVVNAATAVEALASSWSGTTTLKTIKESLRTTSLSQTDGVITAMPPSHPMCGGCALDDGVSESTAIGSVSAPVELTRATAKVTVAYSGGGSHFVLNGANLASSPLKAFIFPDVVGTSGVETITTAHYGAQGDVSKMMVGMSLDNSDETLPLYAYESLKNNETFVIIKGTYNGVAGYYRINMVLPDKKKEALPLLRNYYYRITITRVHKPGYATAQEAIDNVAENGVETTIDVVDPYSHEIMSDGTHFLGVSNSEYWIYDNSIIHEFQVGTSYPGPNEAYETGTWSIDEGGVTYYPEGNGYLATILTYTTKVEWAPGKVTANNGIRFRKSESFTNVFPNSYADITDELTLEPATEGHVTKKIIINIPRDFKEGTITIKIGPLEKKIEIKRSDIISVMGEVLDLGTGYSSGKIEIENETKYYFDQGMPPLSGASSALVKLSTSSAPPQGSGKLVYPNASDNLYLHVQPDPQLNLYAIQTLPAILCEFYLTRAQNQGRVKVHLLREGYYNSIKDRHIIPHHWRYVAAFWRNDQTGERIIRMPHQERSAWQARVVYGADFIRLAPFYNNDDTPTHLAADAEMFQADGTWGTAARSKYDTSDTPVGMSMNFRIALTSKNPNATKPRYGMVIFSMPAASGTGGQGQTIKIYIRQGEEPDYIFTPDEMYKGGARTYSQKISPYALTVPNPSNFPGGGDYNSLLSLNGVRPVFVEYPTQIGYLFQWGHDTPIHPKNPAQNVPITNYAYDYKASEKELCPEGYQLPLTDDANSAFYHSLTSTAYVGDQYDNGHGLCADGYFDRLKDAWGTDNGVYGNVHYNPDTRANIFIPNGNERTDGVGAIPVLPTNEGTETRGIFWAKYDNGVSSDLNKQGIFVSHSISFSPLDLKGKDRKSAFHIRCVKKP